MNRSIIDDPVTLSSF